MTNLPVDHLIHFTKGPDIVASICENGFLMIPNPRELIHDLLGDSLFKEREPQAFGMVCFTDIPMSEAAEHASMYGQYGICVAPEWAAKHSIDRVLYIRPFGPVFGICKWLFETAKIDLDKRIKYPGDAAWDDSYFNATLAQAVAGSHIYGLLLRLYEFMQPDKSFAEREWRIVQRDPVSFTASDRQGMIDEALRVAKTWKIHSIDVGPQDVRFFLCKNGQQAKLKHVLPSAYRDIPIRPYSQSRWLVSKIFHSTLKLRQLSKIDPTLRAAFRRIPSYIARRSAPSTVRELPKVAKLDGLVLETLSTPDQSRVALQYTDIEDRRHQVDIPLPDAMRLLGWLLDRSSTVNGRNRAVLLAK
jgi:hypothetical protein